LGWDNGAWQGVTVTIDDIGTWRAWNGWEWESNGKEANTLGGVLEFAFAPLSTSC